jgi:hypothetical protein
MLAIGDDDFETHQPYCKQNSMHLEVHIMKALGEPMLDSSSKARIMKNHSLWFRNYQPLLPPQSDLYHR